MVTFLVSAICAFLAFACSYGDVIYPSTYGKQQLATTIYCQEEEIQHFQYSSVTKLWGEMGGDIIVKANVKLQCLGDDEGEKYESEALKYLAEISNFVMEEKKHNAGSEQPINKRSKRGVKDFFTDAWKKVKGFFSRIFGGKQESSVTQSAPGPSINDRKNVYDEDDEEEEEEDSTAEELKPLYSVPFQFVQLADGSVPEIRFSEDEVDDERIRNFKRHLVDTFATQLNFEQQQKEVLETTVTGEHTSFYNITVIEDTPITVAGYSASITEEPTVTVKKLVTEKNIRKLAPSEALNDREKMELTLQQMQVFKNGKLQSSSGTSSIVILPNSESKRTRRKRETEVDVTSFFHTYSTFDIQLRNRQKRSSADHLRLLVHNDKVFLPASRYAEKEDDSEMQKLRHLQATSGDKTELIEELLSTSDPEEYDAKMQLISEMIDQEVNLKMDDEPESTSDVVRNMLTEETMQKMCEKNFTRCKEFLHLLALAGGPTAESVFLTFLHEKTTMTSSELRTIAGILSDVTNPSMTFLNSLVELISQKKLDPEVLGSVCLGSGSLGSKGRLDIKNKMSEALTDLLEEQKSSCKTDGILIDVLEAIGNLGCRRTVPYVLEVSRDCKGNGGIQIACAHALRQHCELTSVKQWMQNMTAKSDCDVTEAIVGALLDKIHEQQLIGDTSNWPRNGFNEVDEILKELLLKSRCSVEDTVLYFSKKKDPIANGIAHNYYGPEVEPWNPGSRSRQKRALWDNLNCNEWTEDKKFTPIQGKQEFDSDRTTYNKRKSCLAFRRLGVKGANAEIYAGMFAGVKEPSEPPKYKLFTKFVSGLNFLGHEMEIGSFYFYHNTGETKAYVRILGKTRQEFTHDGCTPTDLKYRPIKHIPLYLLNIASVQISLGIHLSSQLALDTACPKDAAYQLEPMTSVRIGGEALGTVGLSRGGVSLGGNFNYKLQFTFTPTPNMCLRGSHGYDPMSISFETYFQLWNAMRNDWGKRRVWKPSFLSWDVKKGDLKPWFDDTCIRTEEHSKSVLSNERELER